MMGLYDYDMDCFDAVLLLSIYSGLRLADSQRLLFVPPSRSWPTDVVAKR